MTFDRSTSRCSEQGQTQFQWFDCIDRPGRNAIDVAVERFMQVIKPNRLWNPYAEIAMESACRVRLERACAGELSPVSEVEGVDEERPAPLYEIKWKGLAVTDRDEASPLGMKHSTVEVRMYHSEPSKFPNYFVGHHVHEKDVSVPDEVNRRQDVEIAVARDYYYIGEDTDWGIT